MADFDMPKPGTWEQRGGWVVNRLAADLGLSPEQAAGVVGNLGYESVQFTKLQEISPTVPGSAGGYGWAQWTASRRRLFSAWCSTHNLDPASDEANYGFLIEELTGSYKAFTAKLKQCATIADACRLTHKLYETPSDVLDGSYRSGPDRMRWAQRALAGASASGPVNAPIDECPSVNDDVDPDLVADLVRALQRVVDTPPDGIMGPKTIAAIQAAQRSAA